MRAIGTGGGHTCAVLIDSTVKCWGDNSYGQLGNGVQNGHTTIPVSVCGDTSCDSNLQEISTVSGNQIHTCAVTSGGGVKCWGGNSWGALGDGTTTNRTTPVDVTGLSSGVAMVATAREHTCALTTSGGVKCWGNGGLLGDGTTTASSTPVDVSGLDSGVAAIATLNNHTCALTAAGGVKCWGFNEYGGIGDGSNGDFRSTPTNVVGLSSGVGSIAVGGQHTCALMTSGGVKCWGQNTSGQLGDGTTTERDTPVDVQGLTNGVASITAGESYTCAVLQTGEAQCWGGNSEGQLGNGDRSYRTSPVAVVNLKSIAGDANCDGNVDSIDAELVLQYTAGLIPSLACQTAADANHDGSVNSIDAALILQYVAGLIGTP